MLKLTDIKFNILTLTLKLFIVRGWSRWYLQLAFVHLQAYLVLKPLRQSLFSIFIASGNFD